MDEHQYFNLIQEEEEEVDLGNSNNLILDSDELLVDLVKSYPFIYTKGCPEHKDTLMKSNAWRDIGEVLHMSAKEAEHRWVLIREKFTRERKSREQASGSAKSANKPWALYDKLVFLNEHAKRRKTTTTAPIKTAKKTSASASSAETRMADNGDAGVFTAPQTPTTSTADTESDTSVSGGSGNFRKMKRADPLDQEFAALSSEMLSYYRSKKANVVSASSVSVEDQFAALVASELKKLPENVQLEKKRAIMAVLYNM